MKQIKPLSQEIPSNPSFWKIATITLSFTIILTATAGLFYYLGSRKIKDELVETNIQTPPEISRPPGRSPTKPAASPSTKPNNNSKSSGNKTSTKTIIIKAEKSLDGFVSSAGVINDKIHILVGRNNESVTRGLLSFSTLGLAKGSIIKSAVIQIFQTEVVGSPYEAGGKLLIDHLVYGDAIDRADYAFPALISSFDNLVGTGKIGWREVDVTNYFQDDIANARSLSQFRIHFENELRGKTKKGDYAIFESAENWEKTGNTPKLLVKYYGDI